MSMSTVEEDEKGFSPSPSPCESEPCSDAPTEGNDSLEVMWAKALAAGDAKKLFSLFSPCGDRERHALLEVKQEETGANAFLLACLHGDEEFVKEVLELDEHYRESEDKIGNTALHLACKAGHFSIVKLLLQVKAEPGANTKFVNRRNQNGSSALMFAAAFGHVEIVKFLVKRFDANPNFKNKRQETALDLCTAKRHQEVTEYLTVAVKKKAIEDFTKIAVVSFGVPFLLYILYKIYLRL